MAGPLTGITVLELGVMIAIPAATYVLAQQGATVIKVEDTGMGDQLRFYGSEKNGISGWFASANAGKQSLAVDLREDAGKAVLWKLIEQADVLMQGFRPGVIERLGFGWETVHARASKLVYLSSSGFGPTGPYADRPVYDPVIQALAGWAGGQQDDGHPTLVHGMVADKVSALSSAQAVTAALVERGRTGVGQHIVVSMLEANIAFNWSDVMMHCTLKDADASHRPNLLEAYRLFEAQDAWVAIAAGNDAQWQGLCRALDRPELAEDPAYANPAARASNVGTWYAEMEAMVAAFPADDAVARCVAHDVPAARVLAPEEVASDPQVISEGSVEEIHHPLAGNLQRPRPHARFERAPDLAPAPRHGEHTREVLASAGYDTAKVEQLIADGIIKV